AEFVIAEERADHETRMRNRRQGKSEYYERGLRHKDGSTVWTLVSATPVFDDEGRFAGSFGMFTDITEHKRAEAELHEKDLAIRRAYVDVIAAVTGNRLVLMTPEEIDSALGSLVAKPRRIASYRSLSTARHEIRDVIEQRFRNGFDLDGFIVGVGEALTNMIKHAEGGRYEVRRRGNVAQVVMRDKGPGVEFNNLPRATLEAGYSTQGTLGMGFTLMLGLTGRILLSTQPGMTVLVLESPPPG
ncbi:MAG: PAS domain S-box protein, partial [Coriobacteriales bacterium]|nr:PAS domain S-box protein [Coriobacteriales bacterium]